MLTDRLLAFFVALPILAMIVGAIRFYLANPGARARTGRDYARERLMELPTDGERR